MDLLQIFKDYGDKQEILSKIKEDERLRKYSNSTLHLIAAIGDLESPNVTALAEELNMTKGGISKQIKKLIESKLVKSYQLNGNTKNIYYSLTNEGKEIYDLHSIAHKAWIERDMKFISTFSAEQISQVSDFMQKYIEHIDELIEKSENNNGKN